MPSLPRRLEAFRADRSGSVAILTALTLPLLVGGMALGAEVSYWYLSQRKLQQASDLAAYAAAVQLRSGRREAEMLSSASDVAAASGLRAGEDVLAMDHPPATGARAGDARSVEIRLDRQQTRFFTLLYSEEPVQISARAVAEVRGGGDACLLALDPTGGGAITLSGSADITFDGCDVATNSTARDAFDMSGGSVELTTGCVHSVGGVNVNSNLTLNGCDAPRVEAPPVPDPYADLDEPAFGGISLCLGILGINLSITTVGSLADGTPVRVLCDTRLKGTVDLDPGVYIVRDDLTINANADVSGDGVTFFLTDGAELDIRGNADLDLSAPTTGPYAGILFFGDRDDEGVTHTLNGSAASSLSGAVYLPSANLEYSGNFGGSGSCIQLVANRVNFTGNSELATDCSAEGVRRIAVGETIALVE